MNVILNESAVHPRCMAYECAASASHFADYRIMAQGKALDVCADVVKLYGSAEAPALLITTYG